MVLARCVQRGKVSLAGKGIAFLKICSVLVLVLLSRHILNKEHVGIHSSKEFFP